MNAKRVGGIVAAMSLVLALASCGSGDGDGDDGAGDDGAGRSTSGSQEPGTSTGGGDLPDGFPQDIPIPEGDVRSANALGDVGWRLMVAVPLDADGEALKKEYTALYEEAGFTVTAEGTQYNLQAVDGVWRVDLIVRPPTVTVQVLEY